MKRLLICFLTCLLLFAMAACSAAPAATESTGTPETVSIPTAAAETTFPETFAPTQSTAPQVSGTLYLTVSSITFTLVGETEDIYAGSVPRDAVTWSIADESVATFRDGILTATGVGTTTATAEFRDQRIECTVGCLANTEAELKQLPTSVLREPKRCPPADPQGPMDYFSDAAIVGDSLSYVLFQVETSQGLLGSPTYLVRGGSGIRGFVENTFPMVYRGEEVPLEDSIAQSGVKKIFIMLGQNDLSYLSNEESFHFWKLLMERIEEKNPGLIIYVQSVLPEAYSDIYTRNKNQRIREYNQVLKEYTLQQGHYYLDIARYTEDHQGYLVQKYSQDDHLHMNKDGCLTWIQVLKSYVVMTELAAQ